MARGGSAAAGSTIGSRGTRSRPIGTSVPFQRRSRCTTSRRSPSSNVTDLRGHRGRGREARQREGRGRGAGRDGLADGQAQAPVRRAMAAQHLGGRQRALGGHLERVAEARRLGRRLAQDERAGRGLEQRPAARLRAQRQSVRRGHDADRRREGRPVGLDRVDLAVRVDPGERRARARVEERARLAGHGRPLRAQRTRSAGTGTGAGPSAASRRCQASARPASCQGTSTGVPASRTSASRSRSERAGLGGAAPDDAGLRGPVRAEDHEVDVRAHVLGQRRARRSGASSRPTSASARRARRSEARAFRPNASAASSRSSARGRTRTQAGGSTSAASGSAVVADGADRGAARFQDASDRGVAAVDLERDAVQAAGGVGERAGVRRGRLPDDAARAGPARAGSAARRRAVSTHRSRPACQGRPAARHPSKNERAVVPCGATALRTSNGCERRLDLGALLDVLRLHQVLGRVVALQAPTPAAR